MPVYQLSEELAFPHPSYAREDGLLAVGGDLQPDRLLLAYEHGIFPWYSAGDPVLWWSPNPRFVLFPEKLRVSKSMRQVLKREIFRVTFNTHFAKVIAECRQVPRQDVGEGDGWITDEMQEAYTQLHSKGFAQSVEVWKEDRLVGGLYGVKLGNVFFGESMFARESNASKAGFITMVQALMPTGLSLIDCQVHTDHLESLGAEMIPGEQFRELLKQHISPE